MYIVAVLIIRRVMVGPKERPANEAMVVRR
jgi:hypothetical protein